jgi:hypothetical protein
MPAFAGVAVSKACRAEPTAPFRIAARGNHEGQPEKGGDPLVSLLWIILIIVLVLLLLGFFSRGRW